ncbi:hypothetical protein P5609_001435 [Bacillus licheniformis]|uniref:hypothetical protein n=1 Tax=Bacillus licheniformis TaxID=1402 RepID=UPI00018C80CD|nr:hypothetical protein [Bacillus licheniformis]MDH3162351.1 hypothetical protein [Bacillus licheniformis]MED4409038.1 hypothetical protein [Bacillus licheniformis]QDL76910.1 hypothetical protein D9Y32_05275 [Bacillus licheniformis]
MSKSTMSLVKVWKSGNSFNVHINELGIMLVVNKDKQPKSYEKIEHWLSRDDENFITPTFEE